MEFILWIISLFFGVKQPVPVDIQATSTPIITQIEVKEPTKKISRIINVIQPKQQTPVVAEPQPTTETVNTPVASTNTPEPQVIYVYASSPVVSQPQQVYNNVMEAEVTISQPTVELNSELGGKYVISFTVSDTSKKVLFTYNGVNSTGGRSKGGMEFQPNQPYRLAWDFEGTFDYKIDFDNGKKIVEGQFIVE